MAAPDNKSIKDLNGKWVMNKKLSDDPDPILAMQGVPWLTRKAISWSTITLTISQYNAPSEAPSPTPTSTKPTPNPQASQVTHIDIDQTGTGGIKGTTELRILDWAWREHEDHIFGKVRGRTRWIRSPTSSSSEQAPTATATASAAPPAPAAASSSSTSTTTSTPNHNTNTTSGSTANTTSLDPFLLSDWLPESSNEHIHSFVESLKDENAGKWTAEQVWGFARVKEERRYVRRVLARRVRGGEEHRVRLVYDWVGER